ncbi:hypothetical protein DFH06DRAFT_1332351 [Mycena polygramma]|nr:hypothetical protein DFH06DRAFT_1332351 [Mycena polygramma]
MRLGARRKTSLLSLVVLINRSSIAFAFTGTRPQGHTRRTRKAIALALSAGAAYHVPKRVYVMHPAALFSPCLLYSHLSNPRSCVVFIFTGTRRKEEGRRRYRDALISCVSFLFLPNPAPPLPAPSSHHSLLLPSCRSSLLISRPRLLPSPLRDSLTPHRSPPHTLGVVTTATTTKPRSRAYHVSAIPLPLLSCVSDALSRRQYHDSRHHHRQAPTKNVSRRPIAQYLSGVYGYSAAGTFTFHHEAQTPTESRHTADGV